MVRNSNSGHCISRMLQALHLSEPGRHTRFLGLPLRISEEHAVMISRREIRYQVERASKPANVRLFPFPKRGTQHYECTCRNRIKDLNKLSPAPRLKARARTVHLLHDSKRAFPYPLSATFLTKNCFFAMACGEPQPQLLRVMRAQIQNIGGGTSSTSQVLAWRGQRPPAWLAGRGRRGERFIEAFWTFPFLMLYLFSCASLGIWR